MMAWSKNWMPFWSFNHLTLFLGQKLKGQRPARKNTAVITRQIKPRTFFLRLNKSISCCLKAYISHLGWDVKEGRRSEVKDLRERNNGILE